VLEFTRRDVSRGATLSNKQAYDSWLRSKLQEPFLASTHAPPYPIPTSFPHIFTLDRTRARTVPLFTSLRTTPVTASLFRTCARFVETNLDIGDAVGLDRDEMKELANDLWGICDGFGDSDGDEVLDELGEDEEREC